MTGFGLESTARNARRPQDAVIVAHPSPRPNSGTRWGLRRFRQYPTLQELMAVSSTRGKRSRIRWRLVSANPTGPAGFLTRLLDRPPGW